MGLDRLDDAEAAMQPGLRPELLAASLDGDAGADFLLTLAEIQRRRGSLDRAQATLDECVRRCDELGLTSIRVRARREQAELHAGRGDFRAAYEEHKRYCAEVMDLQSAERDARARALQAMYETTEARRQTRRYRELSLRDPLTGLYNRRFVDEQLPGLLERAAPPPSPSPSPSWTSTTSSGSTTPAPTRSATGCCAPSPSCCGRPTCRAGRRRVLRGPDGRRGVPARRRSAATAATTTRLLDDLRRAVRAHPWSDLADGLAVTVSIGAASTGEPPGALPRRAAGPGRRAPLPCQAAGPRPGRRRPLLTSATRPEKVVWLVML